MGNGKWVSVIHAGAGAIRLAVHPSRPITKFDTTATASSRREKVENVLFHNRKPAMLIHAKLLNTVKAIFGISLEPS